jgi:hypothetical protein
MNDVTNHTKGFGVGIADGPTFSTIDRGFHRSRRTRGAYPIRMISPFYLAISKTSGAGRIGVHWTSGERRYTVPRTKRSGSATYSGGPIIPLSPAMRSSSGSNRSGLDLMGQGHRSVDGQCYRNLPNYLGWRTMRPEEITL